MRKTWTLAILSALLEGDIKVEEGGKIKFEWYSDNCECHGSRNEESRKVTVKVWDVWLQLDLDDGLNFEKITGKFKARGELAGDIATPYESDEGNFVVKY